MPLQELLLSVLLFVGLPYMLAKLIFSNRIVRMQDRNKQKACLARLDFWGYLIGGLAILTIVPDAMNFFTPSIDPDLKIPLPDPVKATAKIAFFYLALVAFGIGLARRQLTIVVEAKG